mgnify:CR=1 FL=1
MKTLARDKANPIFSFKDGSNQNGSEILLGSEEKLKHVLACCPS